MVRPAAVARAALLLAASLAACVAPSPAERCVDYLEGTLGACGAELDAAAHCEAESDEAGLSGCQVEMDRAYACLNDALGGHEVTCRLDGTDDWGQRECAAELEAYLGCQEP